MPKGTSRIHGNVVRELAFRRAQWKLLLWRIFPINDLPFEILVNIFTLAILSHSSREVTRSRLAVASVCKRWRRIVLDSPSMWSIIEFKGKPPFNASVLALQRSKNAPLILLIDVRDGLWQKEQIETEGVFTSADMTVLMSHIIPALGRVYELYILCDTWKVVLAALTSLRDVAVPALCRFEVLRSGKAYVSFARNTIPPELLQPMTLFRRGAPRLNHVSLDGVHVNWETTPFKNMRNLEMRKMAVEVMPHLKVFRKMMLGSTTLRTLVLEGSGPQWVEEELDGWKPVELPCLENLTLGDFAVDYGVFMLRLFTAPKLRRLTLCLLEEDCSGLFAKLTGMFPLLTVIFLFDIEVQNDEIARAFFMSMPKLRYLKTMRMEDGIFNLMLCLVPKHNCREGTEESEVEMWLDTDLEPICSRLETAECGSGVSYQNAIKLAQGRKNLKMPLRRLLLPLAFFESFPKEESDLLRDTGILSLIPPGSRPELDSRYVTD